jgi:hypothetical protein
VAANSYGSAFGFVAGDTYAKYTYGGATLFVDESLLVTNQALKQQSAMDQQGALAPSWWKRNHKFI